MIRKVLFVLMLCLPFVMGSCKSNRNSGDINTSVVNNPNTASGEMNTENLPVFSFETEEHDFGRLVQGEKVSYTFKFKNSGKSDLVISSAKASCGCTVADYPKMPIKAGAEGNISVSFDSEGKKGIQNKTVTLLANTQPGTKVLTIKAEIVLPEK
ncbi:MAG: DUF1573 domain-containing protein [Bacteroidota bacterium]